MVKCDLDKILISFDFQQFLTIQYNCNEPPVEFIAQSEPLVIAQSMEITH